MKPADVLGSVIIPAHNEEAVIGRNLDSLLAGLPPRVVVIVSCNGCTDSTADVARSRGHRVTVIEGHEASKTRAIRRAEALDPPFPRLYLDADVVLGGASAATVLARLASGDVLAARPKFEYVTQGCSWVVRRYYGGRKRVPSLFEALWGAGVYGLSESARTRFGEYPEVIGDDLWVDRMFGRDEIEVVDCPPVMVRVPRRTQDLVRILKRAQRVKGEDPSAIALGSTLSTTRGLVDALLPPSGSAVLDVGVYAAFAVGARCASRLPSATRWERDESSRVA